jgi:hypothetical protein
VAAQPVCQLCGQPLYGHYISALNATWHPEHFLCAACHQPINGASFNVHEGQPYHSRCYIERVAPRCAYCGKPLTGEYIQSDGRSYHPDCYRERVVARCVYCNAPLTGEYLVDGWGNKFCKRHEREFPTCEFCGRLVPPSQQERGHRDSIRCPVCRSRAIESRAQARPLFEELSGWMNAQGLQLPAIPLKLELCDRATLTRYMQQRAVQGSNRGSAPFEPHTLGVTLSTTHTLDGREVRTDIDGVAVLRGLPTPLFQGVVVHELGHVWLVTQGIQGLPPWAEEGFCELLSHRYYRLLNSDEGRYYANGIEKNPNPIYGDGFRRVRDVVYRVGFQQYVQQLSVTKRLPT